MAEHQQALEDLALLIRLCDRLTDEQQGSMYHADTLAQRNAVVRRLREFIAGTAGVSRPDGKTKSWHTPMGSGDSEDGGGVVPCKSCTSEIYCEMNGCRRESS